MLAVTSSSCYPSLVSGSLGPALGLALSPLAAPGPQAAAGPGPTCGPAWRGRPGRAQRKETQCQSQAAAQPGSDTSESELVLASPRRRRRNDGTALLLAAAAAGPGGAAAISESKLITVTKVILGNIKYTTAQYAGAIIESMRFESHFN